MILGHFRLYKWNIVYNELVGLFSELEMFTVIFWLVVTQMVMLKIRLTLHSYGLFQIYD